MTGPRPILRPGGSAARAWARLSASGAAPCRTATSRSRIAPTPGAAVSALSRTSDQARRVSPAKQGLAWAPPFSATIICALASPLNDSARASEITCPP